jgi:hypothetical protein
MPSVDYANTTENKKKFALPKLNLGKFGRFLLLLVISIAVYLLSAVLAGVISALSANIDVTSISILFDPQITIAYILVYYSTNHFYKFTPRQTYLYLLFTLLLSFTTNFIQGSITMLVLPPVLKKLKLITASQE